MIGLLFPGQGSQFVGMGKTFYENFKSVQLTFEEGSDALGLNMKKLLFDGPESELKMTENTQPAILLLSVALDRLTAEFFKSESKICLGHSLGEYSALVSNGVLPFTQTLQTVKKRGAAMQKAVPPGEGTMLAVLGTANEAIPALCKWAEEASGLNPVEPANYNAPGQVVISGKTEAVNYLKDNFKTSQLAETIKAKFIPLNVSAPFHCSMMKPAQDEMTPIIESLSFSAARFPIIQNVTALDTVDLETIKKNVISQISAPVKWVQSVNRAKEMGVTRFVELGPGKVLAGLVKKIDSSSLTTLNIETIEDFKKLESGL